MNRSPLLLPVVFALAAGLGCSPAQTAADSSADASASSAAAVSSMPENHPPVGGAPGPMNHGTVAEAIDAGGYTYVRVEAGGKQTWIAGRQLALSVGDEIVYGEGMPMQDWHSDTLDRTWDQVLFVSELRLAGADPTAPASAMPAMPPGHPAVGKAEPVSVGAVEKLSEGQTVAEVHARRDELAGQEVSVRGKVVKANYGIMGRNWIHLRDGSGSDESGDNDLTVTSSDRVEVGQLVSIRGTLAVAKDFGAGYSYPVIVENARFWVE